ncbi:hypothetical protein SLA2020_318790 [Shorea laevis]
MPSSICRRLPAKAKYLGVPLLLNKHKKSSFLIIKDRIMAKISGWRSKLLSQAARTTLLKSVANAIPSYLMSLIPPAQISLFGD